MEERDSVLRLDAKIRRRLQEEKDQLPEYQRREEEFARILEAHVLSPITQEELQEERERLQELIENIEREKNLHFYLLETEELLHTYRSLVRPNGPVSFMGKKKKTRSKEAIDLGKQFYQIIEQYRAYFDSEDLPTPPEEQESSALSCSCGEKQVLANEDRLFVCPDCGREQLQVNHRSSFKDIDRVNLTTKYKYDRRIHFLDAIKQFQGRQNVNIDPQVYTDLIHQFQLHNLLVGDENTPREKRFQKITKRHVHIFLQRTGHSKHYENKTLIWAHLTGKKPPDISHLEEVLMSDFDQIQKVYPLVKTADRSSFLNIQVILYELLRRHGYKCTQDDFDILRTPERRRYHNEVGGRLFALLEWNFTPL